MELFLATLGLVLGVLGIVVAVVAVARSEDIQKWYDRRTTSRKPEQRVTWDTIKGRAWNPLDESRDVFLENIPEILREEDEFRRIKDWLREDFHDDNAEELYIVSLEKQRRRLQTDKKVSGLLYATLDKGPERKGPNTCLIWYLAVDKRGALSDGQQLEICGRLWRELLDQIQKTSRQADKTDIFLEVPPCTSETADAKVREYLDTIVAFFAQSERTSTLPAKVLNLQYLTPDTGVPYPECADRTNGEGREEDECEEEPRILLYSGERERFPADELLDRLYAMYFWAFIYGEEVRALEQLEKRARYYADLKDRRLNEIGTPFISVVGIRSAEARELGLCWGNDRDSRTL